MKPTRRRVALVAPLSLLACGLTLTACGGSSSSGSSSSADAAAGVKQAPYTTTAKPDRPEVKVAFPARITTVDPLQAGSGTDIAVTQLLAGTLYAFGPDGGDETEPSLAQSGSFGPGDKSFTVKLRADATFSDGSPLRAADVVATMRRAKTFKANAWVGSFKPIKAVQAQGDTTVRFTFSRAFPSFTTLLAYPNYGILKASEIGDGGKVPTAPVMAGQYKASGALTGNTFTLERNDAAVVKPAAAKLAFSVITDPNARVQQLGDGQFDFAFDLESAALAKPPEGVQSKFPPTYGFSVLLMNNTQAPTDDVKVRKAISLALDRKKISQVSWNGLEAPIDGFFPTSFDGLSKDAADPDVAAAKKLLEGTPCASGCKLSLTVPNALSWAPTAGVIVQSSLKEIGIDVSIDTVDLATLFEKQFGLQYQLALSYYSDYTRVPEGLTSYCFDTTAGALGCSTGFESKQGTKLVDEASQATGDARDQAFTGLQQLFEEQMPLAPLTDYSYTSATRADASGLISSTPAGFIQVAALEG